MLKEATCHLKLVKHDLHPYIVNPKCGSIKQNVRYSRNFNT